MYPLFEALPDRQCPRAALEAVKGNLMAWGYIPPLLQIPTNRTRTVSTILITPINKVNKKNEIYKVPFIMAVKAGLYVDMHLYLGLYPRKLLL